MVIASTWPPKSLVTAEALVALTVCLLADPSKEFRLLR